MRSVLPTILAALALAGIIANPLSAQLQPPRLPSVGGVLNDVNGPLDDTIMATDRVAAREARRLHRLREKALERLLRRHGDAIERDAFGDLAREGELLAIAPSERQLVTLERAGFRVIEREEIEGLGVGVVRLSVPEELALAQAQKRAVALVPDLELTVDHLHFKAGAKALQQPTAFFSLSAAAQQRTPIVLPVGVIDGAAGDAIAVAGVKGFARGAPVASDHGSAVTSLLLAAGVRRVWVADVYGSDPAGGNALAIAKALGWLTANGCKVVSISLVGPKNPLLERAVRSAQQRGVIVVAAVGNDGPAAPPAYPASYLDVVAVTGVDRRGQALIEAGRALHLDYAAPGAEVLALDVRGRRKTWRGTSFATPLAASRVAATLEQGAKWRATLDAEARDLGKKGPDDTYGRGLLCAGCGIK